MLLLLLLSMFLFLQVSCCCCSTSPFRFFFCNMWYGQITCILRFSFFFVSFVLIAVVVNYRFSSCCCSVLSINWLKKFLSVALFNNLLCSEHKKKICTLEVCVLLLLVGFFSFSALLNVNYDNDWLVRQLRGDIFAYVFYLNTFWANLFFFESWNT